MRAFSSMNMPLKSHNIGWQAILGVTLAVSRHFRLFFLGFHFSPIGQLGGAIGFVLFECDNVANARHTVLDR